MQFGCLCFAKRGNFHDAVLLKVAGDWYFPPLEKRKMQPVFPKAHDSPGKTFYFPEDVTSWGHTDSVVLSQVVMSDTFHYSTMFMGILGVQNTCSHFNLRWSVFHVSYPDLHGIIISALPQYSEVMSDQMSQDSTTFLRSPCFPPLSFSC